jgi:hypothetical protein
MGLMVPYEARLAFMMPLRREQVDRCHARGRRTAGGYLPATA